jgi:putative endopeptidase
MLSSIRRGFLASALLATGLLQGPAARAADGDAEVAPVFDPSALDTSVSPCEDFFRYSCGGWIDHNPIPDDRSSWGRDSKLVEVNNARLREILDEAAAHPTDETRKIGDFYASCLDEGKAEKLGAAPLQPWFQRIDALMSTADLAPLLAELHKQGVGAFFSFGSAQDFKDASRIIAFADQGGLGLPERDYYFKRDPKSVETRQRYLEHVAKNFELLGDAPDIAAGEARAVMAVETKLANGALGVVARRDPSKLVHLLDQKRLERLQPDFGWKDYLAAVGVAPGQPVNVTEPRFFQRQDALLKKITLDDMKTYLRWQVTRAAAPYLSQAFVNENFHFYTEYLSGAKTLQARWKRCVALVDGAMGEDLGRAYVAKYFGPPEKAATKAMVEDVIAAYRADLETLDWMTPKTRAKAIEKLGLILTKIGYPDHWRDYGALAVARDDLLGNVGRASEFEFARQIAKIGKPIDRDEWQMTPPTVNAYYDPQMNSINFPAGILQPPFFDLKEDDAVNLGATGATVGHEMTHGFDDEGRQFDGVGNLKDWWTKSDAKNFETRAQCLVKQYDGYIAVDDVHVNGKLTLGENTADNGGARIALAALKARLAKLDPAKAAEKTDGYTPEQRFFIAYGQSWCTISRPERERLQALTNPHAPPRYRVNGVVADMAEFAAAFACKPGDKMVSRTMCRVW